MNVCTSVTISAEPPTAHCTTSSVAACVTMSYSLSRNGGASDEPSPFGFFSEGFFSAGFLSPSPVEEGSLRFLLEDLEDLVEVGIATTTEELALDDGDDGRRDEEEFGLRDDGFDLV